AAAALLAALVAYGAKVAARPGVVRDDLVQPPARAALPAGAMAIMLAAAAVEPHAEGAARVLLPLGMALHITAMGLVATLLAGQGTPMRVVTPLLFLPFVGLIVSPFAAIPLGWTQLVEIVFALTLIPFVVILAGSLRTLLGAPVPVPQRAPLAIFVAPIAVYATVAGLLGWDMLCLAFTAAAVGATLPLLARAPWLLQGGWNPGWGSFTFPLAALAGALAVAAERWEPLGLLAAPALAAASVICPWLAWRAFRAWTTGVLAAKTAAATA
ncbi:MAG: tellurium resistance protein, partial [Pseudomonadota bacterium]